MNLRSRAGKIARLALLLSFLGGCSGAEPSSTTMSDIRTDSTIDSGMVDTTTTAAPPTTTIPHVEPPRVEATFPQNGAAAPIWDDDLYGAPEFESRLTGLVEAGAGWVTLIPTWYQLEPSSSVIYPENPGRTTTDEALVDAIRDAKDLGLRVAIKPHVDLVDGGSRLSIEPKVEEEWFDSYVEMVLRYATLAEAAGVDQLVVGTELAGTSGNERAWRSVIADVRRVFTGPLTYAANHDEFERVAFWDALDFIGVDAYFRLAPRPTSDLEQLMVAWEPIADRLEEVAVEFERQVVFTELGYPSQLGASVEPHNPSFSDTPAEGEQAAALESMIQVIAPEPWFGGFHWWMWFVEDGPAAEALGYMPAGKRAGEILEEYWAAG